MSRSPIKLIPADFTAVPALANACDVSAVDDFATDLDAVALLVATGTDLTDVVGLGTDALASRLRRQRRKQPGGGPARPHRGP